MLSPSSAVENRQALLRTANQELARASELWTEARAGGYLPNPHDQRLTIAEHRSRRCQSKLDSAIRRNRSIIRTEGLTPT